MPTPAQVLLKVPRVCARKLLGPAEPSSARRHIGELERACRGAGHICSATVLVLLGDPLPGLGTTAAGYSVRAPTVSPFAARPLLGDVARNKAWPAHPVNAASLAVMTGMHLAHGVGGMQQQHPSAKSAAGRAAADQPRGGLDGQDGKNCMRLHKALRHFITRGQCSANVCVVLAQAGKVLTRLEAEGASLRGEVVAAAAAHGVTKQDAEATRSVLARLEQVLGRLPAIMLRLCSERRPDGSIAPPGAIAAVAAFQALCNAFCSLKECATWWRAYQRYCCQDRQAPRAHHQAQHQAQRGVEVTTARPRPVSRQATTAGSSRLATASTPGCAPVQLGRPAAQPRRVVAAAGAAPLGASPPTRPPAAALQQAAVPLSLPVSASASGGARRRGSPPVYAQLQVCVAPPTPPAAPAAVAVEPGACSRLGVRTPGLASPLLPWQETGHSISRDALLQQAPGASHSSRCLLSSSDAGMAAKAGAGSPVAPLSVAPLLLGSVRSCAPGRQSAAVEAGPPSGLVAAITRPHLAAPGSARSSSSSSSAAIGAYPAGPLASATVCEGNAVSSMAAAAAAAAGMGVAAAACGAAGNTTWGVPGAAATWGDQPLFAIAGSPASGVSTGLMYGGGTTTAPGGCSPSWSPMSCASEQQHSSSSSGSSGPGTPSSSSVPSAGSAADAAASPLEGLAAANRASGSACAAAAGAAVCAEMRSPLSAARASQSPWSPWSYAPQQHGGSAGSASPGSSRLAGWLVAPDSAHQAGGRHDLSGGSPTPVLHSTSQQLLAAGGGGDGSN